MFFEIQILPHSQELAKEEVVLSGMPVVFLLARDWLLGKFQKMIKGKPLGCTLDEQDEVEKRPSFPHPLLHLYMERQPKWALVRNNHPEDQQKNHRL